jgi:hypothetical protein
MSAIKVPSRMQEGNHEVTTIWLDDGCELRSTHDWGVNDVQSLLRKVKQGFEINKERLMFIKSKRSSKLRARM